MKIYTSLMWCVKLLVFEVSLPPRLFMSLLVTISITGIENPSQIAPKNPKVINNISALSACMKMDRKEPDLFFCIVVLLIFSSKLINTPLFLCYICKTQNKNIEIVHNSIKYNSYIELYIEEDN